MKYSKEKIGKFLTEMSERFVLSSLQVNQHRGYYDTAKQEIEQYPEIYRGYQGEVLNKMIETNTIILLRIYPNTAVGFHDFIGLTVDEVVTQAIDTLGMK